MKIAIIADPLDNQRAGVYVYTRELVKALMAYDTVNEYILLREKVDSQLDIRQIAIPNIRLPIGFASFRLFIMIPIVARYLNVDAVLEPAHFGPFNLPRSMKRITMIHDLTPILLPKFHRYHSQLLQKVFLKSILRRADLILSNSKNTSADLVKVYPFTTSKIKTIYLGKENFYTPTTSRTYLNSKRIDAPYFLYVGTIEPRKNLNILLEAFQYFRKGVNERVRLLITGQKGWKSDEFYKQLEQHPFREDILLTGFVKKRFLPELYSHSLALVYPSIYEGFGIPLIEAMACGTNVICPYNSSLIEVGGNIAFFYPTHDLQALVEAMKKVFKGGAEVAARRKAAVLWANQFSWKAYAQQFMEAVKRLK